MDEFNKKDHVGNIPIPSNATNTEHVIAIVRLQEEMKNVNYRLDAIETKFDKFENGINARFDKLEKESNERNKILNDNYEKLYEIVNSVLAQTTTTNNDITTLNSDIKSLSVQSNDLDSRVSTLENQSKLLETHTRNNLEDLKELKSFKWKIYGVLALVAFTLSVWGSDLFRLIFGGK